jgi:hypothetical protein
MDVHQKEFIQAVVLAVAVALAMTVWDKVQERAQGAPVGKAETRKGADDNIAPARKTQISRDTIVHR